MLVKKFWEEIGIEIIVIGKWSVFVRIVEIYFGIYIVKWVIEYVRKNGKVLVGLFRYMRVDIKFGEIYGESFDLREGGFFGKIEINIDGINWEFYFNLFVRRYMVFEVWKE